ncbi:hypothetical protein HTT03_03805 [Sulfitobacter sp. S0837]|uniref:hypothetical protein n=1 Tax=Sulfitobacter maritimus TaxID=2741719 RepID=UPI001581ABC6|nr:hypothetical protein [Sulfitobacter maritimus]NUH64427.1 hypothetical protein [Sulfitobacter maritimus]
MNKIASMILRTVIRQLASRGLRAGMRRGGQGARKGAGLNSSRIRQGIRMLRRFKRF